MQKTNRKIALGQPILEAEERQAIQDVVESPWILNGPQVRAFEEMFKEYTGAKFASAVSSCTAGMHLSLSAYGFKSGDEVLIPTFNFIAAGLSILQAGLKPVFVDVNKATGNLDPEDLERKITPQSKAILLLHYAGTPAHMTSISAIAEKHGLKIVQDAAHALGSSFEGVKIGNWKDATSFSFGPLKMICSAGMGGMVTSNDEVFIQKINSLRSYGMNKSAWDRKESQRPWSYQIHDLGHNFRMTDIQAAMGMVQMKKLDGFIQRRKEISERYSEFLKNESLFELMEVEDGSDAVPLYYAFRVKSGLRNDLGMFLVENQVGASVHWDLPLHDHPLFHPFVPSGSEFPQSIELANEVLSLPLHPRLSDEDVDVVIDFIKEFLSKHKG